MSIACRESRRASRRPPRRLGEEALAGGDPELRARVDEVGVRLDARSAGGERVALRLQEIELRRRAGLVPLQRELRRPRADLRLDARGAAPRDVGSGRSPGAVDVVARGEPRPLLPRPRGVRRRVLRADSRRGW